MSKKKGDLLNQLAIISDLLEKVNVESINSTVFFEINDDEFDKIKTYLNKRYEGAVEVDDSNTFSLLIGEIPFVFSKNSV